MKCAVETKDFFGLMKGLVSLFIQTVFLDRQN